MFCFYPRPIRAQHWPPLKKQSKIEGEIHRQAKSTLISSVPLVLSVVTLKGNSKETRSTRDLLQCAMSLFL